MRKYYLPTSIIVLSLILIWLFFFKPFCLWYKEEIRIFDILTLLIVGIAFFALWYQNKNFLILRDKDDKSIENLNQFY